MAQHSHSVKWEIGTKCDVFNRDKFKWEQSEIVGSCTDDKGQWVKVKYGQKVRDILAADPDLRIRKVIQKEQVLELERAAVQIPKLKPILDDMLPPSSGQGFYVFADRESLVVSFDYVLNLMQRHIYQHDVVIEMQTK